MYKRSIEDPAGFWSDIASDFFWKQKWGQQVYFENLDVNKGDIRIEVTCLDFALIDSFNSSTYDLIICLFFDNHIIFCLEQWFKGGLTNICYNCLDRNVEAGLGDRIALYWEGNEPCLDGSLTYSQLLQNVCQVYHYPLRYHSLSYKQSPTYS